MAQAYKLARKILVLQFALQEIQEDMQGKDSEVDQLMLNIEKLIAELREVTYEKNMAEIIRLG